MALQGSRRVGILCVPLAGASSRFLRPFAVPTCLFDQVPAVTTCPAKDTFLVTFGKGIKRRPHERNLLLLLFILVLPKFKEGVKTKRARFTPKLLCYGPI